MAIATISNTVSVTSGTQFSASLWVIPPANGSDPGNGGIAHVINCETNDANLNTRVQVYFDTNGSRIVRGVLSNFTTGSPTLNKSWATRTSTSAYVPGSWHHIFICGDTSQTTKGYVFVNAANLTLTSSMTGNDTGFAVPWTGCSFGVPTSPAESSFFNTSIQMAEVQIWMGTFIDPTVAANLAKFVTVVNSVGRPANPAIAASAFGVPTYSFRGNNAQFPTNRGNGGSMSSSGVINSYTPVPGA